MLNPERPVLVVVPNDPKYKTTIDSTLKFNCLGCWRKCWYSRSTDSILPMGYQVICIECFRDEIRRHPWLADELEIQTPSKEQLSELMRSVLGQRGQ